MKSDRELLAALKSASAGLFVMSESDYPFEIVYLEGKSELSPQYLREMAGSPAVATVETRSVEEFFRSTIYVPESKDGRDVPSVGDARYLYRLLTENLKEIRVYRIGKINIPVYIIGKSAEGNWVGLSTRVIET
jgi:hypothetical protein